MQAKAGRQRGREAKAPGSQPVRVSPSKKEGRMEGRCVEALEAASARPGGKRPAGRDEVRPSGDGTYGYSILVWLCLWG